MEARERLKKKIEAYQPWNEQEQKDRAILLEWLDSGNDILTRDNLTAHLTASGWVVSPDRKSILMAYHNIYNSWSWLGGHADGDAQLHRVAAKEVKEESGLGQFRFLTDEIFSLEILPVYGHVKKGSYVPTHLHLNVTYLMEAEPEAHLRAKPDENSGVQWIAVDEIREKCSETWMVEHIYQKLCEKMKHY